MSNVTIEADDLVEFKYNGGSNPGSTRVVKVRNTGSKSFSGLDVYVEDKNGYRNFDHTKVSNLKLLYRADKPKNTATYNNNDGLVVERKNGDGLSINVTNNNVSVSYYRNGTNNVVKNVAFNLPTCNDALVESLVNILKEFSK